MEKLSKILPKIDGALFQQPGKNTFKRGIIVLHFGDKYASLPLPIFEELWQTRLRLWALRAQRTSLMENFGGLFPAHCKV